MFKETFTTAIANRIKREMPYYILYGAYKRRVHGPGPNEPEEYLVALFVDQEPARKYLKSQVDKKYWDCSIRIVDKVVE